METKELKEQLFYKKESVYKKADEKIIDAAYDFAVDYMKYLDDAKTEREAVTAAKQRRIIKTALLFLAQHPTKLQPRFDVIEVITAVGQPMTAVEINHIPNAHGG